MTIKARANEDGVIKLEFPTHMAGQEIEIVLVMQPIVPAETVDAMGYPIGYFEETYGSFADDPLERNQPLVPDQPDGTYHG
jgi:hypothetical protein